MHHFGDERYKERLMYAMRVTRFIQFVATSFGLMLLFHTDTNVVSIVISIIFIILSVGIPQNIISDIKDCLNNSVILSDIDKSISANKREVNSYGLESIESIKRTIC